MLHRVWRQKFGLPKMCEIALRRPTGKYPFSLCVFKLPFKIKKTPVELLQTCLCVAASLGPKNIFE
jgi:hypothetical protein